MDGATFLLYGDAVEKQQQTAEKTADSSATQAAFQYLWTQIAVNKDVWSQLSGAFTGVLQQTFYSVLLFGLVGFAIGTVLDPVNKAVFLQFIPELGGQGKDGGVVTYLTGYHVLREATVRSRYLQDRISMADQPASCARRSTVDSPPFCGPLCGRFCGEMGCNPVQSELFSTGLST